MAHVMDRKSPSSSPMAGGAPLALFMIAGVVIGGLMGQPTIGLLVGGGLGVALALIIWRVGRGK
jgi:hypothetical protein